jgi:beta-galactosidase GanA
MIRRLPLLAALLAASPALAQVPHLEKRGAATQLIVDGKPFLILGGELGNSSASDREWLAPRWSVLRSMHLNTVLTPVSWELIEPREGMFDFTSVDWLLADARANNMHLVLLWFGAWKNSMSSYAPDWVKRNPKRFPRAAGPDGKGQEILSAFSEATRNADSRAFAALMAHLLEADAQGTVLMVQVENEIGFLPMAREHGAAADAAAKGVTGDAGEEAFSAAAYARYVEAVAAVGKRAYPLPMYVNGAQGRPGKRPGPDYPSGGPLAHLMPVWKRGAPSIDFLAPDIYFPNFAEIAGHYAQPGNPLFVPESNRTSDARAAANAMRIIGRHNAIGFSPFAIEDADPAQAARLGDAYAMLRDLAPMILNAQAEGRIMGFAPPVSFEGVVDETPQGVSFGGYRFAVNFVDPWTPRDKQEPSEHGGMIIWLGGEDFLVAGRGITVTVEPADGAGKAGLDRVEEGSIVDGAFVPGRRLNGDQTHQGRHIRLDPGRFQVQRVRLYRYP